MHLPARGASPLLADVSRAEAAARGREQPLPRPAPLLRGLSLGGAAAALAAGAGRARRRRQGGRVRAGGAGAARRAGAGLGRLGAALRRGCRPEGERARAGGGACRSAAAGAAAAGAAGAGASDAASGELRRQGGASAPPSASGRRHTVALLGADGPAKAAVRRVLLGPGGAAEAPAAGQLGEQELQATNRVWCRPSPSALALVEAPGHVDFLPFVDIALRVCAGSVLRVRHARRPLGVVLWASREDVAEMTPQAASTAFSRAMADLRRLGVEPLALSVPAAQPGFALQSARAGAVEAALAAPGHAGDSATTDWLDVVAPVGDVASGAEAGTWEGSDPRTGARELVRPAADAPFAGITFQTTYLDGGSRKALDMLVVRGALHAGQRLHNATTGSHAITAPPLQRSGGAPGETVPVALPGDVVRLTLPSAEAPPGSGSLCTWCEPSAPVRLQVLHTQAYELLAGRHCTKAEDQSLRVEWEPGDGEMQLTTCGEEQLRRLCRTLRSRWGVHLGLQPCRIQYRATPWCTTEVRVAAGSGASAFAITARVAPASRGAGVRTSAEKCVLRSIGGQRGLRAFARGVRRTCERGVVALRVGRGGRARDAGAAFATLPVVDVDVRLLRLDLEAAGAYGAAVREAALLAAGARCVRRALGLPRSAAGGPPGAAGAAWLAAPAVRVLSPLAELAVRVPRRYAARVAGDLRARGGRVRALRRAAPSLVSVEASVQQASVQGYGAVLAALTDSTATFATHPGGYAEVAPADLPRALAAMAREAKSGPRSQRCPSPLWT
ncbi:unnamed protein product [Prorocentrum cordatum]|uniref:Elongation factor EFG domain-containing protein n=1 Tax=Prorocentrum cordatum TaxID=2364126 RepID=A0ABN9QG39_9DINO|nr:unnamed protein product [Polarella glacialis]